MGEGDSHIKKPHKYYVSGEKRLRLNGAMCEMDYQSREDLVGLPCVAWGDEIISAGYSPR